MREDIYDSFDQDGRIAIDVDHYGSSPMPNEICVKEVVRDLYSENEAAIEKTMGNYDTIILSKMD